MSGLSQQIKKAGIPSYRSPDAAAQHQEIATAYLLAQHQTFTNAILGSTSWWQTTFAGPNTTTVTKAKSGFNGTGGVTGILSDGYARNVVITVTHASAVVALSGVITGIDLFGNTITEAWSVTAGTTSKTFTGLKAFFRVDSVTVTAASDASADSVIIGNGGKLGLNRIAASVKILAEEEGGALPTAGVIVKGSSASTADPRGTYVPNSALNGVLDFDIWYIVENISQIGLGQ